MRNTLLPALFCLALMAGPAIAATQPVYAWNGNQYVFDVQRQGSVTYLTGYRAVGSGWRRVGTTTLRAGQRAPEGGGFLQQVWFNGRKAGTTDADFNSDLFRRGRGGGRR